MADYAAFAGLRGRNAPANQRIGTACLQFRSGRIPVRRAAGQALTEMGLGEGDDGGVQIGVRHEPIDRVLPEAVAADGGDAAGGGPVRASVLLSRSRRQLKPVSVKPAASTLRCGSRPRSAPGGKACAGTMGPRSASVPATVRVVSATVNAPAEPCGAPMLPQGIGDGMPFAPAAKLAGRPRQSLRCPPAPPRHPRARSIPAARASATAQKLLLIFRRDNPLARAGPGSTTAPPSCARHCAENVTGSKP